MNHTRFHTFVTLILLIAALQAAPVAAKSEKGDGEVMGHYSPGGTILTITSQLEFETFWGVVIDYCDGSHEEIFDSYPSKILTRVTLGAKGYTFYAEKPMRRAVIKTLPPFDKKGTRPWDFRLTLVQRKCGIPDPPPQLYCNDVEVARVIRRSWGEPIKFTSTRHVVRAGLSFPGVDGLAPTRRAEFNPLIYFPSIKFDPGDRTWTGTYISARVPVGTYTKVDLVVQDDFGQQAKCRVGKISVLP